MVRPRALQLQQPSAAASMYTPRGKRGPPKDRTLTPPEKRPRGFRERGEGLATPAPKPKCAEQLAAEFEKAVAVCRNTDFPTSPRERDNVTKAISSVFRRLPEGEYAPPEVLLARHKLLVKGQYGDDEVLDIPDELVVPQPTYDDVLKALTHIKFPKNASRCVSTKKTATAAGNVFLVFNFSTFSLAALTKFCNRLRPYLTHVSEH